MIDIMGLYSQACDLEAKEATVRQVMDRLWDTLSDEEKNHLIDEIENKAGAVV